MNAYQVERLELHTLTTSRAEFLTTCGSSQTPNHTWAISRAEWEGLGKPTSLEVRVRPV